MQFENFLRTHGRGTPYREITDEDAARLRERLPEPLVAFLRAEGLRVYGDGLLFTVDDRDVAAARVAFIPHCTDAAVFARTAFGTLFVWDGAHVHAVMPHSATMAPICGDVTRFFDFVLSDPELMDASLHRSATQRASARVGHLAWDEMYGFERPLALGGSDRLEHVRRLKLVEHLVVLSAHMPRADVEPRDRPQSMRN